MQDYKKIKIWERTHSITLVIYQLTASFPKEETYGLTSQLRRSIASIPANIAEGAGRNTKLDFAHFLNIALGSVNESSYHLLLSKDLEYIDLNNYNKLNEELEELKAMLIGFINAVRKSGS